MSDQSDYGSAAQSAAQNNGDGEEGAQAQTAIPVNILRQEYAGAHDAFREKATRRGLRRGFSVPSTAHELDHAKSRWPESSWQLKALEIINSNAVQRILICLLLMDVLILFVELGMDAFFPSCTLINRDAISCCPADYNEAHNNAERSNNNNNDVHRFLSGEGDNAHGHICEAPLSETAYPTGCDTHKFPGVHTAHAALFWTTIVILSAFMLELVFLIYLLGPSKFFRELIYVVDVFVVSCSLALELSFHFLAKNQALEAFPGILILFRLWRFVRIGHGLVASTYEMQEHKTHLALEHIEELEKRLRRCGDEVPERPKQLGGSEAKHASKNGDDDHIIVQDE